MKFATVSKSLVIGLALLVAANAFAATKGSLQLNNPTTVNGVKLKPGDYKVQWEGTGPNVELSIIQGKTVLAKAPARLIELSNASTQSAAVTLRSDNGTSTLSGIRFEGKKYALEVGAASDGMQAGSSN